MKSADRRYDYLIIGAGMYGATAARALADHGSRVLVVEKRDHIAGNAYTEEIDGICVHRYGAHIFHTDSDRVWEFVNRFAVFNGFINEPLARWDGKLYSLPFNMNTFRELWGVTEPVEARQIIEEQTAKSGYRSSEAPASLEEQAVRMVGTEIYEKLIRGYTEKQWGRACSELPASIIKRVPVRFEYNNNYFDDRYQGIPECGYTAMVGHMLEGIDVKTGTDFLDPDHRNELGTIADRIIFTGQIDAFYDYCMGPLEYRGLRFETEVIETDGNYFQPRAVVNYTDMETPWTRIVEHRHFTEDTGSSAEPRTEEIKKTIITREYPAAWKPGDEAYYPMNDRKNMEKYEEYLRLARNDDNIIFGGRLGSYRYYDMDDAIEAALNMADELAVKQI